MALRIVTGGMDILAEFVQFLLRAGCVAFLGEPGSGHVLLLQVFRKEVLRLLPAILRNLKLNIPLPESLEFLPPGPQRSVRFGIVAEVAEFFAYRGQFPGLRAGCFGFFELCLKGRNLLLHHGQVVRCLFRIQQGGLCLRG